MIISSPWPPADLLLSLDAEREVSAAAGSGSEAGADAVSGRLQTLYR
jgi:hypothetical protein